MEFKKDEITAPLRFSEIKSENFVFSDISKDHPNGITTENLRTIVSNYSQDNRYKLIDYLSEWMKEYHGDKSPVDIINTAIAKKLYQLRNKPLDNGGII